MNKNADINDRFERRFGASSGAGICSIGSLSAGLQLNKCSEALLERKKAAMYEAMAKLKAKREQSMAEAVSNTDRKISAVQSFSQGTVPSITMDEFLSQVERATLENIERGLQNAPDSKHIAMYKAMKTLLEKRKKMPPTPREKRTR